MCHTWPLLARYQRLGLLLLSLLLVSTSTGFSQEAPHATVRIGTGSHDGVYFPTGNGICRLLLRSFTEHGLRCQVLSTGGSVANLRALMDHSLDTAIVQSDWLYHAYKGSYPFDDAPPFEALRSLFALHAEPFTVLARVDSHIEQLADLQGRRVNIGNPGSGQRATLEVLMESLGWSLEDFGGIAELPAGEQAQALCDDQVDAIVYTVGHPNASIREASALCEVRLIPVVGPAVEALITAHPYYFPATIPGGLYRGNPEPVASFGVRGMFATTLAMDDIQIYELVQGVFAEFDGLRTAHPALGQLSPEAMVNGTFPVPLHPGAVQYYQQAGLRPPPD